MKNAFAVILVCFIIIFIVSAVRPFWTKYRLGGDIEAAAIYCTKNSIEDTKEFLTRKMKESGHDFVGDDFNIEKNEYNTATISITYLDRIGFFVVSLKTLEFTLEKTAREVKQKF
jgi:type III secretory pathway component EscR